MKNVNLVSLLHGKALNPNNKYEILTTDFNGEILDIIQPLYDDLETIIKFRKEFTELRQDLNFTIQIKK